MQNSFVVRGFHTGTDLPQQCQRVLHRDCSFATQKLIERLTLDVFHHEKENAVATLAEVSHPDDIVMLNGSSGARFAFETRDGFALLQVFVRQHVRPNRFNGNAARDQILVPREIYLAHRASAKSFLQTVTPVQNSCAGQRSFRLRLVVGANEQVVFVTLFAPWTFAHELKNREQYRTARIRRHR